MKKKIKKIAYLFGALSITALVGLAYTHAYEEKTIQPHLQYRLDGSESESISYPIYDDSNYTITLSAHQLNNYTWTNTASYLNNFDVESVYNPSATSINYNNLIYLHEELMLDDSLSYSYSSSDSSIILDLSSEYKFSIWTGETQSTFEFDLEWIVNGLGWQGIKQAIELDIQANSTPEEGHSMGTDIVNAIKSGLGLIGDLASEFLNGFSTLFWDATANQGAGGLTNFATFALVMLGIAITMAVISLVLNVIRGSTGA